MLKTLVRIVCSVALVSIVLQAREMKIKEEITLNIPYKKMCVIEFPFVVTGSSFTPFTYRKSIEDVNDDDFQIPSQSTSPKGKQKKTPKSIVKKTSTPIKVTKGKNVFNIYGKKIGKTQLLVWGHSHPIIINLNITKSRRADSYIKFVDEEKKSQEKIKFESSYHDKIIIKLTEAMYRKKIPKKYKLIKTKKQFFVSGFRFILVSRYVGGKYQGEEYIVTNQTDMTRTIDPEIITGDGIYGVTLVNDILNPHVSTRLFVVRSN